MKKTYLINIITLCLGYLFIISTAWSQTDSESLLRMKIPIKTTFSPNPVEAGARAIGMGGAFIAIANDATAAFWNPAGIIQLKRGPELSTGLDYRITAVDNTFENTPDISETTKAFNFNHLGLASSFSIINRNIALSLDYQRVYDFTHNRNFDFYHQSPNFSGAYKQKGSLYSMGIAGSVQIAPAFSVGLKLNFLNDFIFQNKWEQEIYEKGNIILTSSDPIENSGDFISHKKEDFSFQGININLGFLWTINRRLSAGGIFKMPFTADIEHTVTTENIEKYPTSPENNIHTFASQKYNKTLKMPLSYGIGMAYNVSDRLTLSADIYRTHWNNFEFEDEQGNKTSPVSGKDMSDSNIDATTSFHLGAEYLMIKRRSRTIIPFRAGIFYDPAPAEGSPDNYYGFSLGAGLVKCDKYAFDIAYKYRFGHNVKNDYVLQEKNISQNRYEHTISASFNWYFDKFPTIGRRKKKLGWTPEPWATANIIQHESESEIQVKVINKGEISIEDLNVFIKGDFPEKSPKKIDEIKPEKEGMVKWKIEKQVTSDSLSIEFDEKNGYIPCPLVIDE